MNLDHTDSGWTCVDDAGDIRLFSGAGAGVGPCAGTGAAVHVGAGLGPQSHRSHGVERVFGHLIKSDNRARPRAGIFHRRNTFEDVSEPEKRLFAECSHPKDILGGIVDRLRVVLLTRTASELDGGKDRVILGNLDHLVDCVVPASDQDIGLAELDRARLSIGEPSHDGLFPD